MDLSGLNTKQFAEEGAKMHLKHPITGAGLFSKKADGKDDLNKPCQVIVRGAEADSVQKKLKSIRKRAMKTKNAGAQDEERGMEFVSSLIIGFENIEIDGKKLTGDASDITAFFDLSDSFVEQVLEFTRDRENFFQEASID